MRRAVQSNWRDLLTAYNGNSITYDAIGNPLTYYNGTTFTWVNGKRLATAVNTSTGLNNSYTYDADGLASTGQGFIGTNMFAYCLNNPVNYK